MKLEIGVGRLSTPRIKVRAAHVPGNTLMALRLDVADHLVKYFTRPAPLLSARPTGEETQTPTDIARRPRRPSAHCNWSSASKRR